MNWKKYKRKGLTEMRPYMKGEDLSEVSVWAEDCPETDMGMIARDSENHKDQWYVNRDYFERHLEEAAAEKTMGNSDVSGAKKNVPDIKVFGDGDLFKLLSKASSENEGWMKSTKAMEIPEAGCLVQVTTQQRNPDGSYAVAEALSFVPGVRILDNANGRRLVAI